MPVLARVAALCAMLALTAWAWHVDKPATALSGALGAMVVIASLVRNQRRRERALLRLIETWAAGERAFLLTLDDPQARRAVAAVNQRLFDGQGRLWARIHMLQALVDQSPAALLRIADDPARSEASCEPLNNAARRLLTALDTGLRPAVSALGEEFAALVRAPAEASTVQLTGQPVRYAISVAELVTAEGTARIVALVDVQDALDRAQANAWRDLARVLSHEIMNALAPITSLAESATRDLKTGAAPPTAVLAVEALGRRAQALLRFVEAYRAMARPLVPRAEVIALEPWLAENLMAWRAQWGDEVQWRSQVRPAALAVRADPALLQQALGALAVNAVQAARAARQEAALVVVSAQACADGRVLLTVDDNGAGISAAQRAQVFVPFYTTKPEGSGIGLSLARQIVLAHGGRVGIDDSPLGGARISIELLAAVLV